MQNLDAKQKKKILITLFSVILLDLIGFALLVPTLPLLADYYHANGKILGAIFAVYTFMQFLFSQYWGRLSDRIGRKKVLIISIMGSGCALVFMSFAVNLWMLFFARLLGGIFAANIGVASAYITDITPPKDRTKSMGLIGVAFGLGFIIGPAIGGMLIHWGLKVPIIFTAALNFINAFYAIKILEKDHDETRKPKAQISLKELFSYPLIGKICLINFLFTMGITQLETSFAFFVKASFHVPDHSIYYIFTFMAFLMVLIQGGLIRRLAPIVSDKKLIIAGCLLLALAFWGIAQASSIAILYFPLALASLGRGVSQPALTGWASKSLDISMAGAVMGVFTSSANLARCVGQISAGSLYDINIRFPMYLAASLMLVVVIITLQSSQKQSQIQ